MLMDKLEKLDKKEENEEVINILNPLIKKNKIKKSEEFILKFDKTKNQIQLGNTTKTINCNNSQNSNFLEDNNLHSILKS